MTTTIKIKNSTTIGSTPTALALGEFAVNVTDEKVWVGNSAQSPVLIVENAVLTSPFTLTPSSASGAEFRLPEDSDNGSNYVSLKAPDALSANLTLTLPSADGSNGDFLSTNGSGALSFISVTPLSAATKAEQETASSTSVYVTPGRQQYHPSAAKSWIKANASGTISASYNVASITDLGNGEIRVTFTTAFSSADYCITSGTYSGSNGVVMQISTSATTYFDGICYDLAGNKEDPSYWNYACFGDQ